MAESKERLSQVSELEQRVLPPSSQNQDFILLRSTMASLETGMVLELELDITDEVTQVGRMVREASKELGEKWKVWGAGNKLYAKPTGELFKPKSPRTASNRKGSSETPGRNNTSLGDFPEGIFVHYKALYPIPSAPIDDSGFTRVTLKPKGIPRRQPAVDILSSLRPLGGAEETARRTKDLLAYAEERVILTVSDLYGNLGGRGSVPPLDFERKVIEIAFRLRFPGTGRYSRDQFVAIGLELGIIERNTTKSGAKPRPEGRGSKVGGPLPDHKAPGIDTLNSNRSLPMPDITIPAGSIAPAIQPPPAPRSENGRFQSLPGVSLHPDVPSVLTPGTVETRVPEELIPDATEMFTVAALVRSKAVLFARTGRALTPEAIKTLTMIIETNIKKASLLDANAVVEAVIGKLEHIALDEEIRRAFADLRPENGKLIEILMSWPGKTPGELLLFLISEGKPQKPSEKTGHTPTLTEIDKYSIAMVLQSARLKKQLSKHAIYVAPPDRTRLDQMAREGKSARDKGKINNLPDAEQILSITEMRLKQWGNDKEEFLRINQDHEVRWLFTRFFSGLNPQELSALIKELPNFELAIR